MALLFGFPDSSNQMKLTGWFSLEVADQDLCFVEDNTPSSSREVENFPSSVH